MEKADAIKLIIIAIICIACIAFLVVLAVEISNGRKKEFISNEILFDDKYIEKRKQLPLKVDGVLYPYSKVRPTKLLALGLIQNGILKFNSPYNMEEFYVYMFHTYKLDLYQSFIYSIFDDIKDFESPLSKKFFEDRPNHIINEKPCKLTLKERVKNILEIIPKAEFLSINEYFQISDLVYEIAVHGCMKCQEKFKKIKKVRDNLKTEDAEEMLRIMLLEPNSFEQAQLFYEGLCKELHLKINVLNCTINLQAEDRKNYFILLANNIKEITFIVFDDGSAMMKREV